MSSLIRQMYYISSGHGSYGSENSDWHDDSCSWCHCHGSGTCVLLVFVRCLCVMFVCMRAVWWYARQVGMLFATNVWRWCTITRMRCWCVVHFWYTYSTLGRHCTHHNNDADNRNNHPTLYCYCSLCTVILLHNCMAMVEE